MRSPVEADIGGLQANAKPDWRVGEKTVRPPARAACRHPFGAARAAALAGANDDDLVWLRAGADWPAPPAEETGP